MNGTYNIIKLIIIDKDFTLIKSLFFSNGCSITATKEANINGRNKLDPINNK